ncbi:MAG TPA: cellulose biosynthesis protein BcsG [Bdellovibrionota bacterium]|jgi:cellulose synthase operon protein YhjU
MIAKFPYKLNHFGFDPHPRSGQNRAEGKLGIWNFYFLAKIYLYLGGYIDFHPLLNALFFAGVVLLPLWLPRLFASRASRLAFGTIAGFLAFLLFWKDSFFPPIGTALAFADKPSAAYVFHFLLGYWNPWVALVLALLLAASIFALRYRLALGPVVFFLVAAVGVHDLLRPHEPLDEAVDRFYAAEAQKKTMLPVPASGSRPFDIVILHVCSLSWDDLKVVGLEKHPFFANFDLLFTDFNSVTSYSTPATLRVLRSTCGQASHLGIYSDADEDCYLLQQLRRTGYSTQVAFNHEGKLSKEMAEDGIRWGKADHFFPLTGMAPESRNFDESPLYNNYALLERWWKTRLASGNERAMLYFNTSTLHGGAHLIGQTDWWKQDELRYQKLTNHLFDDLSRFFSLLKESNRDVLVVFVPEHGAALRGTKIQAKDLRDIPLPPITKVPVGLKYIRHGSVPAKQTVVSTPTSFQAIAYLLAAALRSHGSGDGAPWSSTGIERIPTTPFLSENESARVFRFEGTTHYTVKGGSWHPLRE